MGNNNNLEAPILRWSGFHAVLLCSCIVLSLVFKQSWLVPPCVLMSVSLLLYIGRGELRQRHWGIGRANLLSLARLAGALGLFLFSDVLSAHLGRYVIPVLFLLILCLDGADGYLARRWNESSILGGYLDMEIDACIILLMCVMLWQNFQFSALILLPGSLRYVYVLALKLLVDQPVLEPRRRYASVIAVVFSLSLILNLAVQSGLASVLLVVCSIALILSFGQSLLFQLAANPN